MTCYNDGIARPTLHHARNKQASAHASTEGSTQATKYTSRTRLSVEPHWLQGLPLRFTREITRVCSNLERDLGVNNSLQCDSSPRFSSTLPLPPRRQLADKNKLDCNLACCATKNAWRSTAVAGRNTEGLTVSPKESDLRDTVCSV